MSPARVGDVLEGCLGHRVEMGPYGFELRVTETPRRRARLQRGSGIAGRGDVWALVALPTGAPIVTGLRTKVQICRAVLEFMAGPPPSPLRDFTKPRARRVVVPRTGESRFAWVRHPKKRPGPKVVLVPFGAAQR